MQYSFSMLRQIQIGRGINFNELTSGQGMNPAYVAIQTIADYLAQSIDQRAGTKNAYVSGLMMLT